MHAIATVLFALISFIATGCGATCDRNPDRDPIRYTDGVTDAKTGFYETSDWKGPYIKLNKGDTYWLFHGLGSRPRQVGIFLSFEPNPLPNSNTALAAGNQSLIQNVTDEYVEIRNDTCSDIYMRVTASFPEDGASAARDAGTE